MPDEIFMKLKKHLENRRFRDIELIRQGSTEPTKTPVTDDFVQVIVETAEKVYGKKAVLYPTSAGSGPMHLFRNWLGYPVVSVGCGHPEANTHAPNENLRIASFIQGTKFFASILHDFSVS
jgi:acetylornithine deacetylase/succinyl-diaminopimelate desuccinylase-like protein